MRSVIWFRRDFRLTDHSALYMAEQTGDEMVPTFVFDDTILKHPDTGSAVVSFMLSCLRELDENLRKKAGKMHFLHGKPKEQLVRLCKEVGADRLLFHKDYAPGAVERDENVRSILEQNGVQVEALKDQVIYEEQEILTKSAGEPYTVYSPYKRAWLARVDEEGLPEVLPECHGKFLSIDLPRRNGLNPVELYTPEQLGFACDMTFEIEAGENAAMRRLRQFCAERINNYKADRDFPAIDGTSRLSPHLRHGTISPRQCLHAAFDVASQATTKNQSKGADHWISEIIWREFYQQILFNFPHVETECFRREYNGLEWDNDDARWQAWCDGKTGVPIVDAAMRQLNATGWMHNRLRMIVAMFLTKDMLLDYKLGERYFMQKLIDGETAQNNGGWQWSASTGTDAAPYFRIFNPYSQSEKFDPEGEFIRQWVPELADVPKAFIHKPHEMGELDQQMAKCVIGSDYPAPIVDHSVMRDKAIAMFKNFREDL